MNEEEGHDVEHRADAIDGHHINELEGEEEISRTNPLALVAAQQLQLENNDGGESEELAVS